MSINSYTQKIQRLPIHILKNTDDKTKHRNPRTVYNTIIHVRTRKDNKIKEREQFYDQGQNVIETIPQCKHVITLGDFSARIGNLLYCKLTNGPTKLY